jgi:hypothetical protein
LLGTDGTEFKLIAGESEGRGTVSVGQVTSNGGEGRDLQVQDGTTDLDGLEVGLREVADITLLLQSIQDLVQVVTQESGDNTGGSFVGTETVLVGRRGDTGTEKTTVLVDGIQGSGQEEQEAVVGLRLQGGVQQVVTLVSGHGPVAVLSGTVDTLERLLVEQNLQLVTVGNLVQDLHGDQVVVDSNGSLLEDRSNLELVGGDFIVAGLDRDTDLHQLVFGLRDGSKDTGGDLTKVVVLELLVLGGRNTDQSTASDLQVGAELVQVAVDQEELLLSTQGGEDTLGLGVAEDSQESDGSDGESLSRTEEDGLFIQSLTVVGDEDGGDVQDSGAVGATTDEHGANDNDKKYEQRMLRDANHAISVAKFTNLVGVQIV